MQQRYRLEEIKVAYKKLGLRPCTCSYFTMGSILTVCPLTALFLFRKYGEVPDDFPNGDPLSWIKEINYFHNELTSQTYQEAFTTGYDFSKTFREMRNESRIAREGYADGRKVADSL